MSKPPTVSVVVPTHNRADLIGETLESVLAQTFTDFEVIVVDNGSTDGTERVVAALRDPRIRYYWQQDSGLPANSRNVGIRMARGRYIAFLDSDDLWLPGKLELQVSYMQSHPEVGLTCTNAEAFSDGDQRWRVVKFGLPSKGTLRSLLRGCFIATLTAMVRRECLESVGLFDEDPDLRGQEDYDLWLRIASRYPFKYISGVTARYRIHGENLLGRGTVSFTARTIEILRRLDSSPDVPRRDLQQGLATHYRRLARSHALIGNREGYRQALASSWLASPGWKTGTLLVLNTLMGFGLSRRMTALAQTLKAGLDYGLWWIQNHMKCRPPA